MPRPPRAKIASSAARVPRPKPAPHKRPTRTATAQNRKASQVLQNFSDDSDGLVTQFKRAEKDGRHGGETDLVVETSLAMTGALPAEEHVSVSLAGNRTPTINSSKRTRTARNVTVSARKSSPTTHLAVLRSIESDAKEDAVQEGESSGFGDLTFSSLASDSPAHGTRPSSVIKVGATPVHERSVLALTNFKRRARQPSLLRTMQQATGIENDDQDDLDNTNDPDFDDFVPHAESTPLKIRRGATDDDIRNDSATQISSSGSRGAKRKLSPSSIVQVPQSSLPFSPSSGTDIEAERPFSPSSSDVLPSREILVEQTPDNVEPMSDTYAPPLSSSPVPEISMLPLSTKARPRQRERLAKTPVQDEEHEAEETETKLAATTRGSAKKQTQPSLSTAQLTNLLPRRRNISRAYDKFDLGYSDPVDSADSDQDELQIPDRRNRYRPRAGKLPSPKMSRTYTRGGKKVAPAKNAHTTSRTYSRRIDSDKENDEASRHKPDTEPSPIEQSARLAAIKKKFEEVDAFELDFETVDASTSSSPFR